MRLASCTACLLIASSAATTVAAERSFASGYAGSLPPDRRDLARTYFDDPEVRGLIGELEQGPIARDRADRALEGKPFGVPDLLRVGLLREDAGRLYIAFNYLTAEDVRAIQRACDRYVPALVRGYLAHRRDFDRLFAEYGVPSVSTEKLAFVIIAGFSLNWEGLAVTRDRGYRKPVLARGDGWSYTFWASERVAGRSFKEVYWGSSTFPTREMNLPDHPADFAFSSFGDPLSDPRMSFPDLLLMPRAEIAPPVRAAVERIGTIHETRLGFDLPDVLGMERAHDFAALLFALRAGPRTSAALARVVREPANIDPYLTLLAKAQYVERDGRGRYHLLVPVLDLRDRALVERSLALSREIIVGWLEASYASMRSELGTLTAMRHGVPFESLFTQIWHEVFGQTTRELAHAGLIHDTYGQHVIYKGSLPTLWRLALYDRNID